MRALTLALAVLLLASPACAEPLITPLRAGEGAQVDGWLYPRAVHRRITSDLKAADLVIAGLRSEADEEARRADALRADLEEALSLSADADSRLLDEVDRAERAEARAASAPLWWALCGVLTALPLWADEVEVSLPSPRLTSAALALSVGLAAWLTGD